MIPPGVHALPPGADFARLLVRGLIAAMADQPPEAMARVTLILNAGRMMRSVRTAFAEAGAGFLPRLRLVTDLGADPRLPFPPAVPSLRRRLELAQLVARLTAGQADMAAGTSVHALADSLAALLAEMQTEGVTPDRLAAIEVEGHAAHWDRSLRFLNLIAPYFDDGAAPDAAARQARAVAWQIAEWQRHPPEDPVVIAGSTGSRGATRDLMVAIARLARGTVVLPGFDTDLPDAVWAALDGDPTPAEDHPQYRFRPLLQSLGLRPSQVGRWLGAGAPVPERAALVSMALRPAPVTDQWLAEGPNLPDLAAAMAGVTLIDAPDPRSEAGAIALILRDAVNAGQQAALISPDRVLTRRVAAALDRWGIRPDDSAGEPLPQTAPGRLIRHVAAAFGRRVGIETLLVILKHPLTAAGAARGDHLRLTRALELHLRRRGPAFPEGAALTAWAARRGDPVAVAWADWLGQVCAALNQPAEAAPLPDWVARLDAALALIGGGPMGETALWDQADGRAARAVLDGLTAEAAHGGAMSAPDFADLLGGLLTGLRVPPVIGVHPQVQFLGTQEARAITADLVILGGLTEGSWPAAPAPDPWLSRPMRMQAGLLLPERRIGLQAHDFQQAVNAPRVVISHARRDDEAEMVPSRWVSRIANLLGGLPDRGGPQVLAQARARGQVWLDLAARLDLPRDDLPVAVRQPAPRPSPRPGVALRPRELPVTDIARLLRDPYAIYARRILRLRPLDPIRPSPDAALRGTALHDVIEAFIAQRPDGDETPAQARARLLNQAEAVFEATVPWPAQRRFWLARVAGFADALIAAEAARRPLIAASHLEAEAQGRMVLPALDFTLTARPDRIDLLNDGTAAIFDYKSGTPPSETQALAYDRQLLLEAVMARAGAFAALDGPRDVSDLRYIRLGGDAREVALPVDHDTLDRIGDQLAALIAAYDEPAQGYTARRAMHRLTDRSDYDHLSRFGEWSLADDPVPQDMP
ncbi:double-strand break repair protein AddB [Paracoccus sp. p4-l81]|uniref:double-strand break repair protein AddB n=1 Tax=Paracoccus sp. p4-l81 TaxID=3342806 RepID=UPI0035BB2AD3